MIGRQDDEIGGLFPFVAVGIDKGDAGRALARGIEIDPRDFAVVARREIRLAQQRRQDRGLRRGFRIVAAAEPFAEAAEGAGTHANAERILIRTRHVAGRLRKRLVAELARRLRKQRCAERLLLGRIRIGPRARSFEGIAAVDDLALEVAGLSASAAEIFEAVVIRLELVIGDAPVLDRHVLGQKAGAVAFGQVGAQDEVGRQESPRLGIPVHAAAADAVGRHESAPGSDRQRRLVHLVAEREGGLLRSQEELVTNTVAQLVGGVARRIVGGRIPPRPALDCDHIEPGIGKLVGHDRSGPTETDDDDVLCRQFAGHVFRPCEESSRRAP